MEITLGKKIAMLRKQKKLKQDEMAEMQSVTPQAVSKWENDQTCPDISLLPKLAEILGVSIDELLSPKKETEPSVRLLSEPERKNIKDMMLRIVINSANGETVKVNIPMALVEIALESGMNMPQMSGNDSLKNIDLNQILELVHQGAVGNLLEVECSDGTTVQIFVE